MDNKKIEIPFVAKDSKLCGWEYTIPEGMEAVIENGKVIVRKTEGEDERMIEMIIDCLNRAVDVKYISLADRGKCLAYLERQKEEADRRLEMVEQHCKNVDELGEKIKSLQKKLYGKQKEQKPSEKQDYSGLNDLERAIHRGFLSAGVENVPVTIIKETAQDCLSQMKPAEWSEEDVTRRESCMLYLANARNCIAFSPYIGANARESGNKEIQKDIDWLKSLRPDSYKNCNSRWKPSEEQMEVFKQSIEWNDDIADEFDKTLQSLYNDLKKL